VVHQFEIHQAVWADGTRHLLFEPLELLEASPSRTSFTATPTAGVCA
jgi:hypothetical protein